MPSGATIRPARGADWPAMRECFRDAAAAAWSTILPQESLARLEPPDRWHTAIYQREGAALLVADYHQHVVGFVAVRASGDEDALPNTGEIDALYVAPRGWGQGVGRELLSAAIDWLRAQGVRRATLWTEERNERPRRFYTLQGWREDGAVRERSVDGVPIRELRYLLTW